MKSMRQIPIVLEFIGLLLFGISGSANSQEVLNGQVPDKTSITFQGFDVNERGEHFLQFHVGSDREKQVPIDRELAKLIPSIQKLEDLEIMTHSGERGYEVNSGDELQFSPRQQAKIRGAWQSISVQFVRLAVKVSQDELMPSDSRTEAEKIVRSIDAAFDLLLDEQKQRVIELQFWDLRIERGLISAITTNPVAEILEITPEQSGKIRALREEADEEVLQEVDALITKYRQKGIDSLPVDIRAKVKPLVPEDWTKEREDGSFRRHVLEMSDF